MNEWMARGTGSKCRAGQRDEKDIELRLCAEYSVLFGTPHVFVALLCIHPTTIRLDEDEDRWTEFGWLSDIKCAQGFYIIMQSVVRDKKEWMLLLHIEGMNLWCNSRREWNLRKIGIFFSYPTTKAAATLLWFTSSLLSGNFIGIEW